MDKPDVDYMHGFSPAMAIQQKTISSNPRSTVGTTTEIYDYIRLLYARIGRTISPLSGRVDRKDTPESIIDELFAVLDEKTSFYVLFHYLIRDGRDEQEQFAVQKEKGLTRFLNINNETILDLTQEDPEPGQIKPETHRVLITRLAIKKEDATRSRIAESIETAFREGDGRCSVKIRNGEERIYSERFERDGIEFREPIPQMFSFNNPFGACRSEG